MPELATAPFETHAIRAKVGLGGSFARIALGLSCAALDGLVLTGRTPLAIAEGERWIALVTLALAATMSVGAELWIRSRAPELTALPGDRYSLMRGDRELVRFARRELRATRGRQLRDFARGILMTVLLAGLGILMAATGLAQFGAPTAAIAVVVSALLARDLFALRQIAVGETTMEIAARDFAKLFAGTAS